MGRTKETPYPAVAQEIRKDHATEKALFLRGHSLLSYPTARFLRTPVRYFNTLSGRRSQTPFQAEGRNRATPGLGLSDDLDGAVVSGLEVDLETPDVAPAEGVLQLEIDFQL